MTLNKTHVIASFGAKKGNVRTPFIVIVAAAQTLMRRDFVKTFKIQ